MTQNVDAFVSKLCDILGYEWPRCHTILIQLQTWPTQLFVRVPQFWYISFKTIGLDYKWFTVAISDFGILFMFKKQLSRFLIQFKFEVERHVTHSWKKIIAVRSNHLFWSKTRLHFGSFLAKVSRVVSASKSDVSKTSLLTGRGYPPSFQKTRNPTVVEDRHFTWWPL